MFTTAIAGSLPKPSWLAEAEKLWPPWKPAQADLPQAQLDATQLWIKAQEDAGLDVMGDGEQSRQHFVHGFLEQVQGIDFEHKVEMGIRDNRYKALVPQVTAALKLRGRVHAAEARFLRAHTRRRIMFTSSGAASTASPRCAPPLLSPTRSARASPSTSAATRTGWWRPSPFSLASCGSRLC